MTRQQPDEIRLDFIIALHFCVKIPKTTLNTICNTTPALRKCTIKVALRSTQKTLKEAGSDAAVK